MLGVYVGPGDLEEANWRPRITAVENVLASWRQRALSFRGRALVIGSLALSRILYVASLVHMPLWVHAELAKLIFPLFWKGKRDLVARVVVTQPPTAVRFSVVDIKSKIETLLVQWVRHYASSPSGWVAFFSYWVSVHFHTTIDAVLANPSAFHSGLLAPFYRALLSAWREVEGSYSQSCSSLVVASPSPHHCCPVAEASAKHVYQFLLSENRSPPHCVDKFRPQYGELYWPFTWSQLFCFDLDRPVIDLSWKVADGVLYTAYRLIGFGYAIDPNCFCSTVFETPSHLFFSCRLAHSALSWLQSLMFSHSSSCPSLVCRHALFGFAPRELRSLPKVFIYILNVCKFFIWHARNDFRFQGVRPDAPQLITKVRSRVGFHLLL